MITQLRLRLLDILHYIWAGRGSVLFLFILLTWNIEKFLKADKVLQFVPKNEEIKLSYFFRIILLLYKSNVRTKSNIRLFNFPYKPDFLYLMIWIESLNGAPLCQNLLVNPYRYGIDNRDIPMDNKLSFRKIIMPRNGCRLIKVTTPFIIKFKNIFYFKQSISIVRVSSSACYSEILFINLLMLVCLTDWYDVLRFYRLCLKVLFLIFYWWKFFRID